MRIEMPTAARRSRLPRRHDNARGASFGRSSELYQQAERLSTNMFARFAVYVVDKRCGEESLLGREELAGLRVATGEQAAPPAGAKAGGKVCLIITV